MLATPGPLPEGPEWLYEVVWDGMRLRAEITAGTVALRDPDGREWSTTFPELAGLAGLGPDVVLDGEVVLLDRGVPSAAALTERLRLSEPERAVARPVTYMAFDVLRLYGVALVERPLEQRRATLERLDTAAVPNLAVSPGYTDGPALLVAARQRGMAGVVGKRRDSIYRPGRGPDWVTTSLRVHDTHGRVRLPGPPRR